MMHLPASGNKKSGYASRQLLDALAGVDKGITFYREANSNWFLKLEMQEKGKLREAPNEVNILNASGLKSPTQVKEVK